VCINRWDGLSGPLTVEAEGLPKGVSCLPVHISPQTQFANVVFTATADAPEWSGAIRLKAWATVEGKLAAVGGDLGWVRAEQLPDDSGRRRRRP